MGKHTNNWERPQIGWLKCNYDVTHHDGDTISGMGWILRDSNECFQECGFGKFEGRHTERRPNVQHYYGQYKLHEEWVIDMWSLKATIKLLI